MIGSQVEVKIIFQNTLYIYIKYSAKSLILKIQPTQRHNRSAEILVSVTM